MPLCVDVGVGPGHIVLDGDPAHSSKRAELPQFLARPCLLWPSRWMDQDNTWYGGRSLPRRHCARWGPSFLPSTERGTAAAHFLAHVYCGHTVAHLSNCGWMNYDATRCGCRPRPRPHCVRWGPSSLPKSAEPPIFGPCLLWPNRWMDQDNTWYGGRSQPRRHCGRWEPSSLPSSERDTAAPHFLAHVYCGQMVAHLSIY